MKFVEEYQQIARHYKLNYAQKLQYLHNILSKDARGFYFNQVDNYAMNFQQAAEMINREYNSLVRQARVKKFLNSICVICN